MNIVGVVSGPTGVTEKAADITGEHWSEKPENKLFL